MVRRLRFARRLLRELPRQLCLAYCLMFDSRVPASTRAVFAAALTLIVTPVVDLPALIPYAGELDALALTLLSLRLFIAACPQPVVAEQEQLITEHRSRFDRDIRNGERLARRLLERLQRVQPAPGAPA